MDYWYTSQKAYGFEITKTFEQRFPRTWELSGAMSGLEGYGRAMLCNYLIASIGLLELET